MQILDEYSFKNGKSFVKKYHPSELRDIIESICGLDAVSCLTKVSKEKTMRGKLLFSPNKMNDSLKDKLHSLGWTKNSEKGKKKYIEPRHYFGKNRFREMDGIKNKVGLEIQFGKYAFMGYDIFSKMIIFKKLGYIDCGIEVVPSEEIIKQMSTGVSSFPQLLVDLKNRGEGNIDIPVYIISLGLTKGERINCERLIKLFKEKGREALTSKLKIYHGSRPGPK